MFLSDPDIFPIWDLGSSGLKGTPRILGLVWIRNTEKVIQKVKDDQQPCP